MSRSLLRRLRWLALTVLRVAPLRLRTASQLANECIYLERASQKPGELAAFLELVRRRRPQVVVEIGTKWGGTFYGLCRVATADALLISIDLPCGPFGGVRDDQRSQKLQAYGRRNQTIVVLEGDSHEVEQRMALVDILGGRRIDLLFIDGDHSYQGVRADSRCMNPWCGRAA